MRLRFRVEAAAVLLAVALTLMPEWRDWIERLADFAADAGTDRSSG